MKMWRLAVSSSGANTKFKLFSRFSENKHKIFFSTLRHKGSEIQSHMNEKTSKYFKPGGIQIAYTNSSHNSRRKHPVSITKTNTLILFTEIMAVYSENSTKYITKPCE
jgi:hypothetical protein